MLPWIPATRTRPVACETPLPYFTVDPALGTPRRRLTQATPRALAAVAFVKMATHHGRLLAFMGKALNLGKLAVKARPSHWEQQAAFNALSFNPHAQSVAVQARLAEHYQFHFHLLILLSGKLKQASPRKAEATAKSKQEQRLGCQSFAQRWLKRALLRWTLNFACLKREQNRDQSLFWHCFHICLADALMQEAEPGGIKENPVTSSLLGLH